MSIDDGNIVLGPGEGKIIPVPGHKVTLKVVGADTDGAYSLLEVELDGDGPPQHIHKAEDEAFYVLEGEIKVPGRTHYYSDSRFFRSHPQGNGSHLFSGWAGVCQGTRHLYSSRNGAVL